MLSRSKEGRRIKQRMNDCNEASQDRTEQKFVTVKEKSLKLLWSGQDRSPGQTNPPPRRIVLCSRSCEWNELKNKSKDLLNSKLIFFYF